MGIGTYTQDDVRAAAFCFTGWRVDPRTGTFSIAARQHSTVPQTFLGVSGVNSGQQVIDLVTQSHASSRFVPSRFWSFLAYPVTPSDPVVADLAPGTRPTATSGVCSGRHLPAPGVHAAVQVVAGTGQTAHRVRRRLAPRARRHADGPGAATGLAGRKHFPGWARCCSIRRASAGGRRTRTGSLPRPLSPAGSSRTDWRGAGTSPWWPTASPTDRVDAAAALLTVPRWSTATAGALKRAADDPPTLVTLALVSPEFVDN